MKKEGDMKPTMEYLADIINSEMVLLRATDRRVVHGAFNVKLAAFWACGKLWTTKSALAAFHEAVAKNQLETMLSARRRNAEHNLRKYHEKKAAMAAATKTQREQLSTQEASA
jgi:hypothetical protein